MASKHTKSTPVRVALRRDGRILCDVCDQLVTLDTETGRIPEHDSTQLGVACPRGGRKFEVVAPAQSTRPVADKHRVRGADEIKSARERERRNEKRQARRRAQTNREREPHGERKRRPHWSEDYAIYCEDSFGKQDDGFEPHERERTRGGGLPGLGKRN